MTPERLAYEQGRAFGRADGWGLALAAVSRVARGMATSDPRAAELVEWAVRQVHRVGMVTP